MADVFIWWLIIQILGWTALPLAWRLFASLPDRGYAFAKPMGIFVVSYALWILAILGILKNTRGTIVFIVAAFAIWSWWWVTRRPTPVAAARSDDGRWPGAARSKKRRVAVGSTEVRPTAKPPQQAERPAQRRTEASPAAQPHPEIIAWLRANLRIIAVEEVLFLAALLLWSLFKAYNPEITATEKPMELAFVNAILRSEQFPPLDPWLSGYSISYYYMGYLMMAVLTRMSGLASSITFNLSLVLSFALTVTGAFSLVYNLVTVRRRQAGAVNPLSVMRPAVLTGLLGSFLVAIMGNLQGFLEALYIRGIGSPAFWKSVGIADMTQPYVAPSWYPTTNWWWWKASRVIGTPGPIGDYTINEFPFFSFMLGDNHPHVLALPYVLMALALALSILLAPIKNLLASLHAGRWPHLIGEWLAPAVLLGGLFFLNSWDFPTYTLIAILAYGIKVYRGRGVLDRTTLLEAGLFAVAVGVLGVLFYLPFYLSFQSQASGFGVVRVRTQLHHFLIIYSPFLVAVSGLLAVKIAAWRSFPRAQQEPARAWLVPLAAAGLVVGVVFIVLQIWTAVTTLLFASLSAVLVSLLLLALLLIAVFALLSQVRGALADAFVLLITAIGFLVLLGPEWLHINDNFGGNLSRMNTVFKFHYQGWVLLALASAYSVHEVVTQVPWRALSWLRAVYAAACTLLFVAGTFYPVMAFYTKANMFQGTPTLDGIAYMQKYNPEDYYAIQWLNANVKGAPVIVEAIGGEYSEYARVSTHTGLPAVQGWGGHEVQWRGTAKGWEAREGDVNRIYSTTDVNEAKTLLSKYNVTYVYVGRLERETRGSDGKLKADATALAKFGTFMDVVYQQGSTIIYRTR